MTSLDLTVDQDRLQDPRRAELFGIQVHARSGDQIGTFDVGTLDRPSLVQWMRQDGGTNEVAESYLLAFLGYEQPTDWIVERIRTVQRTIDRVSLIRLLRHGGGNNDLVENMVLALLGFSPLTADDARIGRE